MFGPDTTTPPQGIGGHVVSLPGALMACEI
jgi:hypothetical protein